MSAFLTAEWRKLIMAQYEVAPATLAPWLPAGVELDIYQGCCFVSLVGFLFQRVRVKGIAVPWHTQFEEVNLRFYVKRTLADGSVRRGVVFVSEIVPRHAITFIARTLYGEAYSTAATRHEWTGTADDLAVSYEWRHAGRWQRVGVQAAATAVEQAPGSVEEFLTEHYWGYTKRRDGSTSEYGVQHPRWQIYPVRSVEVQADFGALYGEAFADLSGRERDNVLLAEGSAVAVRSGSRF